MSSQCKIELADVPISLVFEDIEEARLDVFFALGIVNPFGPTLSFVASAGAGSPGAAIPLVHVVLNPFTQVIRQVGSFTVGDEWEPERVLAPAIALGFGDCPTLLLLNRSVPEAAKNPLATAILRSFGDGAVDQLQRVKANFCDPWTRVSKNVARMWDGPEAALADSEAPTQLAELLLQPAHIGPELSAFIAAWQGSIEKTRISGPLKRNALSAERFENFLFRKVLPCLDLPDAESPPKPAILQPPVPINTESPESVRRVVQSDEWRNWSSDDLLQLAKWGMFLYGVQVQEADIPHLARLYQHVIAVTDAEHRGLMVEQTARLVEEVDASPVAFLPVLIYEPDDHVVSTATINFVSCSPAMESGELLSIVELEALFCAHTIRNPGAVFGALVCMGEERFEALLDRLWSRLTCDQVAVAIGIYTPFTAHGKIQFWLKWASRLVSLPDTASQELFGLCAAAIANGRTSGSLHKVFDGQRDFPCQKKDKPIVNAREWTVDEYAQLLAPRLYRLEETEAPPKLMSRVLRVWGLKPAAAPGDQARPDQRG